MFEEMKARLESGEVEGEFGYDDEYADYVYEVYAEAINELANQVGDPTIEVIGSTQAGRGCVDMICEMGTTTWDFEYERETLADFVAEANNEEEYKNLIVGFLLDKYEDCEPEYDFEEDDEYEGCEEED